MKQTSISDIHNHNLDIEGRIIYLHDYISDTEGNGIDYRVGNQFIKNLNYLDSINNNEITIYLNSEGGDYLAGLSMYDAIKRSPSYIKIIGHGDVSSTASIILQAGDYRLVSQSTWMVVHNGANCIEGNTAAIQNAAKADKRMLDQMLDIYAERCVNGEHFVDLDANLYKTKKWLANKLMKESDWWLSSDEALHYGLIDKILE